MDLQTLAFRKFFTLSVEEKKFVTMNLDKCREIREAAGVFRPVPAALQPIAARLASEVCGGK